MKKSLSGILSLFFILSLSTTVLAQELGMASYYSDDYQGRKTAYGDVYDKSDLTAAHKKHPYGTILKVTRLDNDKYVTVKVNDKGPYVKGRVVELSRKAAERIGLVKDGLAEVKVEVVKRMDNSSNDSKKITSNTKKETPKKTAVETYEEKSEPQRVKTSERSTPRRNNSSDRESPKESSSSSKSKSSKAKLVKQDYTQYGLYQIELRRPEKQGYGVQVASLTSYENVLKQVADLQAKWFDNILVSGERGSTKPVYKIILGPLENEDAATSYKNSIKKKYKISGFVVNLSEIDY